MKTFKEFVLERDYNYSSMPLEEALIMINGIKYPKFNTVVIMAGGSGSGKGFIKDKLLGVEGWVFDVDALKTLAVKTSLIRIKMEERGVSEVNFKNPKHVSMIHEIIKELEFDKKWNDKMMKSIFTSNPDRKPNLIFDITLKDKTKLVEIVEKLEEVGYEKNNINLVWVITDIEIALLQNKNRERVISDDKLKAIHEDVSNTMNKIIKMDKEIVKYLDGDIVFVFNSKGDIKFNSKEKQSNLIFKNRSEKEPGFVDKESKQNIFFLKKKGQPLIPFKDISKDLLQKIQSYVPKGTW